MGILAFQNIPEAEKSNLRFAGIHSLESVEPESQLQADAWTQTLRSCAFPAVAPTPIYKYKSAIEPQSLLCTFITGD